MTVGILRGIEPWFLKKATEEFYRKKLNTFLGPNLRHQMDFWLFVRKLSYTKFLTLPAPYVGICAVLKIETCHVEGNWNSVEKSELEVEGSNLVGILCYFQNIEWFWFKKIFFWVPGQEFSISVIWKKPSQTSTTEIYKSRIWFWSLSPNQHFWSQILWKIGKPQYVSTNIFNHEYRL